MSLNRSLFSHVLDMLRTQKVNGSILTHHPRIGIPLTIKAIADGYRDHIRGEVRWHRVITFERKAFAILTDEM